MATYKDIDHEVRRQHGVSVKTCWIAHVKAVNGLHPRRAWNRASGRRAKPCPPWARRPIERAMKRFGMI
jgi:hypothetical protein